MLLVLPPVRLLALLASFSIHLCFYTISAPNTAPTDRMKTKTKTNNFWSLKSCDLRPSEWVGSRKIGKERHEKQFCAIVVANSFMKSNKMDEKKDNNANP